MSQRILSFDIGISNLAYCEIVSPIGVGDAIVNARISKWEIISLRKKNEKIDFDEMMKRLLAELKKRWPIDDTNLDPLYPTTVLLENQPCMKNPVMKSIQVYIYAYFSMSSAKPQLFSASNKLKVRRNTLIPPGKKQSQVSYGERKKMAIAVARLYLKCDEERWTAFFEREKKKDDYSDCYLQAIYHLENLSV